MQDDFETPLFERAWTQRAAHGTCRMRVQVFALSVRLSRLKRRAPCGDVAWETLCEVYRRRPGGRFDLSGVAQMMRDVLAEQLWLAGERQVRAAEIVGVRVDDLLREPARSERRDGPRRAQSFATPLWPPTST